MNVDVLTINDNVLLSDLGGDVPFEKSLESVASLMRSKGGRPVGSTIKAIEDSKKLDYKEIISCKKKVWL